MHLLSQSDLPGGHGLAWQHTARPQQAGGLFQTSGWRCPGKKPGALSWQISTSALAPIRFIATHMGLLRNCRYQQAGAILSALARLPPLPTVLMGDLNEWRTWRGPLKVFEPFFGRPQSSPSFPSRMPVFSLDRIMGWPRDLVTDVQTHRTPLAREASDHAAGQGGPAVGRYRRRDPTMRRRHLLASHRTFRSSNRVNPGAGPSGPAAAGVKPAAASAWS